MLAPAKPLQPARVASVPGFPCNNPVPIVPVSDETIAVTDPDQARAVLREAIETSREIVRQSGLLIALAESEGVHGEGQEALSPAAG